MDFLVKKVLEQSLNECRKTKRTEFLCRTKMEFEVSCKDSKEGRNLKKIEDKCEKHVKKGA